MTTFDEPRALHAYPDCAVWNSNLPCDCQRKDAMDEPTGPRELDESRAQAVLRLREIVSARKRLEEAEKDLKTAIRFYGSGEFTWQGKPILEIKAASKRFSATKAVDIIPEELHHLVSEPVITAALVQEICPQYYDACCTDSAAAVSTL